MAGSWADMPTPGLFKLETPFEICCSSDFLSSNPLVSGLNEAPILRLTETDGPDREPDSFLLILEKSMLLPLFTLILAEDMSLASPRPTLMLLIDNILLLMTV